MRVIIPLLPLLSLVAAAPALAQAIVVPIRCQGACPAAERLPGILPLDTVKVWMNVGPYASSTFVWHYFRNVTTGTVDAAFFLPLPDDVTVYSVSVSRGAELIQYNEWSREDEARWILRGLAREGRGALLRDYGRRRLVHVPLRDIPPGETRQVQVSYSRPTPLDRTVTVRYPLGVGASASPIGKLELGMEVETEGGFLEIRSPSHPVSIETGSEAGPCAPQARCGTMGVPSHRVRVVRMEPGRGVRERDFVLVYTPIREAIPPRRGPDGEIDLRPAPGS